MTQQARRTAIARAVLHWLYVENDAYPFADDFLELPESRVDGEQVEHDEFVRVIRWLDDRGLVDGVRVDEQDYPVRLVLTSRGRSIVVDEDQPRPPVVFISYAWDSDDPAHSQSVRRLWELLRSCRIDARLDLDAAQRRQDWPLWMGKQIREADYVLVIASRAYRERAEGRSGPDQGRGVQWEARLIRDAFYADQHALNRFVPVVLPGQSAAGVPDFLSPAGSTVYHVSDFTVEGAEKLVRLLTDQPEVLQPPLGATPVLPPRPSPPAAREQPPGPVVRNVVNGGVSGTVIQAGSIGSVTATAGIQVGEGAGLRTRRAFENAFRQAGGADHLGRPTDKVFEEGPVFVQHFTGAGESDAVICAFDGQPAVVVAGPVWDDLSALPGFPAQGLPKARADAGARLVDLAGGAWGEGVLHRSTEARPARWQPKPRLSPNAREAFRLPLAESADVTVRAIATLPWPLAEDLEITGRTRQRIEAALPLAELTALTRTLSLRRGAPVTAPQWERASGPNARSSGQHARYDQTLPSPIDGSAAVRAVARLMLPSALSSAMTVSVEYQVDFPAWRAALVAATDGAVAADLRITANEIVELWTAAWDAATVVVPGALVPDPETAALLAPPAVELQIKLDDEVAVQRRRLLDVADLSVFGKSDEQPGPQGVVTVVAPIGLGRAERRALATNALTRMARGWGFADADESDVDNSIR
ncbi:SEFIR domain-containing protein [Amycolatopsis sp. cg9]|uniref:SEFIR domain-containing protein n=1 Tax=Amycolatopsis sp. cg9 TaxID=3238801 RepID=UPI003525CCAB